MARETKVGLLAGLAFIICFAVILTNRGRESMIEQHFPRGFSGYSNESVGDLGVATSADGASSTSQLNPQDRRRNSGLANRTARPQSSTEDRTISGHRGTSRPSVSGRDSSDDEWRQELETRVAELTAALQEKEQAPTRPITMTASPAVNPQERVANETNIDTTATRQPADATPTADPVRYRVVKGDTLSSIAHRHYGTRSATIINAIFDANRSQLASPGQVRADSTLVLPEVQGFPTPSTEPSQRVVDHNRSSQPPAKREAPASKRFRWYQIQKNDRYASIARRELGDEKRWPELHELNKDKFPDAGHIREGVRIKIPVDSPKNSESHRS